MQTANSKQKHCQQNPNQETDRHTERDIQTEKQTPLYKMGRMKDTVTDGGTPHEERMKTHYQGVTMETVQR